MTDFPTRAHHCKRPTGPRPDGIPAPPVMDSPTVSEPRTELRDAGDCGGAYHYGLCNSCGTYISVVPEAAQPIDAERLARALTAKWRMVKAAGYRNGPTPLELGRAIMAEYARLSGEEQAP